MTRILFAIAVLSIFCTAPAFAENTDPNSNAVTNTDHMEAVAAQTHNSMNMDQKFKMMDTNHDGVISKDEYLAAMAKKFDTIDSAHTGTITEQQMSEFDTREMMSSHSAAQNAATASAVGSAPTSSNSMQK